MNTKSIIRYLFDSDYRFLVNSNKVQFLTKHVSDVNAIEIIYRAVFGENIDLENPQRFNEKLQWLKLNDRNRQYAGYVDKYEVKKFVAASIGEQYIIPALGVWDSAEDIDFDSLPERFALKCTHDSSGVIIVRDKRKLDIKKTKKQLQKRLKHNYYWNWREWAYKNVTPRIMAEQYMSDSGEEGGTYTDQLTDYKIHVFNGIPKIILVCKDRYSEKGVSEDFFDIEWNHLDVKRPAHRNSDVFIERPEELDQMLDIATRLAGNIPFVRVDLYVIAHRVFFGELTLYPAGGFETFEPDTFDYKMGQWLTLPIDKQH